jgi:hypothetical protein
MRRSIGLNLIKRASRDPNPLNDELILGRGRQRLTVSLNPAPDRSISHRDDPSISLPAYL